MKHVKNEYKSVLRQMIEYMNNSSSNIIKNNNQKCIYNYTNTRETIFTYNAKNKLQLRQPRARLKPHHTWSARKKTPAVE